MAFSILIYVAIYLVTVNVIIRCPLFLDVHTCRYLRCFLIRNIPFRPPTFTNKMRDVLEKKWFLRVSVISVRICSMTICVCNEGGFRREEVLSKTLNEEGRKNDDTCMNHSWQVPLGRRTHHQSDDWWAYILDIIYAWTIRILDRSPFQTNRASICSLAKWQ
jgi:hypothetical protein